MWLVKLAFIHNLCNILSIVLVHIVHWYLLDSLVMLCTIQRLLELGAVQSSSRA